MNAIKLIEKYPKEIQEIIGAAMEVAARGLSYNYDGMQSCSCSDAIAQTNTSKVIGDVLKKLRDEQETNE